MKRILKNLGIVGGGTAAACAVCCAAPSLLTPLLAWLGITGAGLAHSPLFALLMLLPAMVWIVQFVRRRTSSRTDTSTECGCESMCSTADGQKSICR